MNPRELRASDTDRDRVVAMLAEALADGRLDATEHAERTQVALNARTLGELAGLTADLAAPSMQPLRVDGGRVITGLFGNEVRNGRWVVPESLTVSAVFGEVTVDFREAMLQSRHVMLHATAIGGRLRLIVPDGLEVVLASRAGFGRLRGATVNEGPPDPTMPVIEIRAFSMAGDIQVLSPPRPRRRLFSRR
jgi:Domain of unknown function (DUF1707)/Cell wall-active antibiotics response 4TMS YvqF